jgi:hypothetical protein
MNAVQVYVSKPCVVDIDGKEYDMIGMIGTVKKSEWIGADVIVLVSDVFGIFQIEKRILEELVIDSKTIIHQGRLYKSKIQAVIIFEKVGFWTKLKFLFCKQVKVDTTIYCTEDFRGKYHFCTNLTIYNVLDKWFAKKRKPVILEEAHQKTSE